MKRKRTPKYRVIISMLAAVLVMMTGGCTVNAPPRSAADELRVHRWIPKSAEGNLVFQDSTVQLSVQQGDNCIELCGEYFTDKDKLTVISDTYGTVVMYYELTADKLILKYFDKEAVFTKADEADSVQEK